MTTPKTVEETLKEFDEIYNDQFWVATQGKNDIRNGTIKSFLTTFADKIHKATMEEVRESLPKSKQSIELMDDFMITAEFRLGELRGFNEALRQVHAQLKQK